MAIAAGDCVNVTKPITIDSGQVAILYYNRSNREDNTRFRGYRAYNNSVLFAFIGNGSQEGNCTNGALNQICLTRTEFRVWNDSHLIVKIVNTTVNDSGLYAVESWFVNLADYEYKVKCLEVIELKIEGKELLKDFNHILETYVHLLL